MMNSESRKRQAELGVRPESDEVARCSCPLFGSNTTANACPLHDGDNRAEMVLLTERCTERNCGTRVRYGELTDDLNTHWHVRKGVAVSERKPACPDHGATCRSDGTCMVRGCRYGGAR
jgi:hypothetical protein